MAPTYLRVYPPLLQIRRQCPALTSMRLINTMKCAYEPFKRKPYLVASAQIYDLSQLILQRNETRKDHKLWDTGRRCTRQIENILRIH